MTKFGVLAALNSAEVGLAGKEIKATSVLCIGAGGLGSPIAMYLAAAALANWHRDFDTVDYSNLQRQFSTRCRRGPLQGAVSQGNVGGSIRIAKSSFTTRAFLRKTRLISFALHIVVDAARIIFQPATLRTMPACYSRSPMLRSIFRFEGQASVFAPHLGGRVIAVFIPNRRRRNGSELRGGGGARRVAGHHRLHSSDEILNSPSQSTSLVADCNCSTRLDMKFRELKLRRDPACPICGDHRRSRID